MRLLEPTILPRLLATRVEFPFGGTAVKTRAFLAQRSNGENAWIYASSHVKDYVDHIKELGGAKYQLLTHRDEASKYCNTLEAPVFCHELEKDAIVKKGSRLDESFSGPSHELGDDMIAYHAPGHTDGATCYLWKMNENESVLFTGDTVFGQSDSKLGVAIHPSIW